MRPERRQLRRVVSVITALTLVTAACGGDDAEAPADTVTEEAVGEPTAESAGEPTAESAGEPTAESADEPTAESVEESTAESVEESTAESVEESTAETVEESTAESVEESADEPAAEPTGEPIKIGTLTSLTGNFTPWGIQVADGMQLAVDEINAGGGVDGRPLELVITDDQSNAEEGVAGLERMIEDGVVAVGGPISSDVGLNTAQFAESNEVPLFLVKAGSDAILTTESRYTFRTCIPPAPSVAQPIAQFAASEGLTKIGAIIADYGWGRAIEASMKQAFDEVDGLEYQIEVAPVSETDFTTYLRNLEAFGPELIVATGHPPGSGAITVQSNDIGFSDLDVTGAYTPWALVAGGAGDAAIGRYADFKCADFDDPDYQDMAKRYLAMSDNEFMEDDAVAGYGIVTMVAQAIEAVGDDPVAISEWIHGQSFDLPGYAFPLSYTEWGEMAAAAPIFYLLGEGPAPEGVNEAGTWYPELLSRTEPLAPFEP